MLSYLDELDQELAGFKKPPTRKLLKRLQPAQQILRVFISTTGANEVWDTSWKRP